MITSLYIIIVLNQGFTQTILIYRQGNHKQNVWKKPGKEYAEHILFHYEKIRKIKENFENEQIQTFSSN